MFKNLENAIREAFTAHPDKIDETIELLQKLVDGEDVEVPEEIVDRIPADPNMLNIVLTFMLMVKAEQDEDN